MLRRGFTLVELLVVIAIIGMLVALLLPAINSARESGRRVQCANNEKQIALAAIQYQENYGAFPYAVTLARGQDPTSTTQFGQNWLIRILPFLESADLQKVFNLSKPISDSSNALGRATRVPDLLCPSDALYNSKPYMPVGFAAEGENWARGNYACNCTPEQFNGDSVSFVGPGSQGWRLPWLRGVMGVNESCALKDIPDGASHVCLLAEVRSGIAPVDRRGTWAMGAAGASIMVGHGATDDHGPNNDSILADDLGECSEIEQTISAETLVTMYMGCYNGNGNDQATARSMHPGGVNLALCDGTVQFISDSINVSTTWAYTTSNCVPSEFGIWEQLMSAGDGQTIPNNAW
jgi:prepilin-type N-terminal cleavage/methylation domain-containing protein